MKVCGSWALLLALVRQPPPKWLDFLPRAYLASECQPSNPFPLSIPHCPAQVLCNHTLPPWLAPVGTTLPHGTAVPELLIPNSCKRAESQRCSTSCPQSPSHQHGVRVPSGPSTSLASARLQSRLVELHKTNRL